MYIIFIFIIIINNIQFKYIIQKKILICNFDKVEYRSKNSIYYTIN